MSRIRTTGFELHQQKPAIILSTRKLTKETFRGRGPNFLESTDNSGTRGQQRVGGGDVNSGVGVGGGYIWPYPEKTEGIYILYLGYT
jgi:hypothetical protein